MRILPSGGRAQTQTCFSLPSPPFFSPRSPSLRLAKAQPTWRPCFARRSTTKCTCGCTGRRPHEPRVCVHDGVAASILAAARAVAIIARRRPNRSHGHVNAGLLELRSWASPGVTADPANRTTRGRRLDILDKLGKAVNPYLDPTKQQEMYSVGVGKLLGNNCPKLEARAPPSSIERVGVQDVHMVLCAGDSPLLGINAKGSSLLGAILKEMRKSDAVARYQGANVASNGPAHEPALWL